MHRRIVYSVLFTALILASPICPADDATHEIDLSEQNYVAWRDHVLPSDADLGWQEIPWLTTLQDGISEADQRNRPLLLWTMNGHPLGCT